VRVELAERVPGLAIAYNSKCQTYQVQGKMPLIWDVQELERALCGPLDTMPTFGRLDFLPASESDWAQEERERLRRWVTQVGLETMERWYQTGDYEKCIQLAERLLPLDPLDEALHTFLLNATWHARGELAARHLYRHSASAFVREVGEVPQGLSALERHWRTLH
jgi:two-component SAPR family response regulator